MFDGLFIDQGISSLIFFECILHCVYRHYFNMRNNYDW